MPTRAHFVRLGNDKSGGGGKLTKRCKKQSVRSAKAAASQRR